jgi:hypothetical protein
MERQARWRRNIDYTEKDEYGLFVNAENYIEMRTNAQVNKLQQAYLDRNRNIKLTSYGI